MQWNRDGQKVCIAYEDGIHTHTHSFPFTANFKEETFQDFPKVYHGPFCRAERCNFSLPLSIFSLNHKHYTFPAIKYPSTISSPPLLPPPRGCHSGLSGWKSYLGQRHQGCPAGPSCMVSGQQSHSLWYRDWGGPHLRQPRLLQCEKNAVLNVYQPVHYTGQYLLLTLLSAVYLMQWKGKCNPTQYILPVYIISYLKALKVTLLAIISHQYTLCGQCKGMVENENATHETALISPCIQSKVNIQCLAGATGAVKLTSVEWYSGINGYAAPNCASLVVVFDNGRAQLMKNELDECTFQFCTHMACGLQRPAQRSGSQTEDLNNSCMSIYAFYPLQTQCTALFLRFQAQAQSCPGCLLFCLEMSFLTQKHTQ